MKLNWIIAALIAIAGLALLVLHRPPENGMDPALADLVATIPPPGEPERPPVADVVVRVSLPACPPEALYCPVEDESRPLLH